MDNPIYQREMMDFIKKISQQWKCNDSNSW